MSNCLFNITATTEIYTYCHTLSLHDALPIYASVAGVTFSEFALAKPSAWIYIRPMLEENDGWATFITTPRGRNHAKALFDMAKKDMDSGGRWFAEISSVHETGALSAKARKSVV